MRIASANLPGGVLSYVLGEEVKQNAWIDFVQGITLLLRKGGHELRGFDLYVSSDVPMGGGLSSSAAFEVAILKVLKAAFSLKGLGEVEISRLGQRVENEFVGAHGGIMDQMAAFLTSNSRRVCGSLAQTRSFVKIMRRS